jgi:hypothetical protein
MGLYAGENLTDYILLHSAAQALQRSAQSLQSASENDEPLAANLAH